jgi:hypothetical protein
MVHDLFFYLSQFSFYLDCLLFLPFYTVFLLCDLFASNCLLAYNRFSSIKIVYDTRNPQVAIYCQTLTFIFKIQSPWFLCKYLTRTYLIISNYLFKVPTDYYLLFVTTPSDARITLSLKVWGYLKVKILTDRLVDLDISMEDLLSI